MPACGEQIDQVIMANRNHSEIFRNGRCAGSDEVFSKYSHNGKTQQQKREHTKLYGSKMAQK